MAEHIRLFITRSRNLAAGLLITGAFATSLTIASPMAQVSAANCENANIVYCGLQSGDVNTSLASLRTEYNKNNNHGHTDIRAVVHWAGGSTAAIKDSASQWQMGTLYHNGDIKSGGDTVGKDAWVAARFTKGSGYVKVTDGVWARKTTTYLREKTAPVLIHFDSNKNADFAVMTTCGNAVKFTAVVKPQPTPAPVTPTPTPQAPTPVTPTPTTPLPKTGGSLAMVGYGIFGTTFAAGTLGYRWFLRRKYSS